MSDTSAEPGAGTFQEDPEPAVLCETQEGQLLRYPAGTQRGFPVGSVIWINAKQFGENCREEVWKKHLQSARPELCNVDSTRAHSARWKMLQIWPALLALAEVRQPGAGDETAGNETPEEGDTMAKGSKKVKNAGSGNKGNGAGRGRKSSLDLTKKIQFDSSKPLARAGSKAAKRLGELKPGMLVSTALERGATALDINWLVSHNRMTLE